MKITLKKLLGASNEDAKMTLDLLAKINTTLMSADTTTLKRIVAILSTKEESSKISLKSLVNFNEDAKIQLDLLTKINTTLMTADVTTLKRILKMLDTKEESLSIDEKWSFSPKNNAMSYVPTIETMDQLEYNGVKYETSLTIGWSGLGDDEPWFANVYVEDLEDKNINMKMAGWEVLAGPGSLDIYSKSLKEILAKTEKSFKVKVDTKAVDELVSFVGKRMAGLV